MIALMLQFQQTYIKYKINIALLNNVFAIFLLYTHHLTVKLLIHHLLVSQVFII